MVQPSNKRRDNRCPVNLRITHTHTHILVDLIAHASGNWIGESIWSSAPRRNWRLDIWLTFMSVELSLSLLNAVYFSSIQNGGRSKIDIVADSRGEITLLTKCQAYDVCLVRETPISNTIERMWMCLRRFARIVLCIWKFPNSEWCTSYCAAGKPITK